MSNSQIQIKYIEGENGEIKIICSDSINEKYKDYKLKDHYEEIELPFSTNENEEKSSNNEKIKSTQSNTPQFNYMNNTNKNPDQVKIEYKENNNNIQIINSQYNHINNNNEIYNDKKLNDKQEELPSKNSKDNKISTENKYQWKRPSSGVSNIESNKENTTSNMESTSSNEENINSSKGNTSPKKGNIYSDTSISSSSINIFSVDDNVSTNNSIFTFNKDEDEVELQCNSNDIITEVIIPPKIVKQYKTKAKYQQDHVQEVKLNFDPQLDKGKKIKVKFINKYKGLTLQSKTFSGIIS